VVDWFSRRVLSWRVSITMEAEFCIEALEEALAKHGTPDIFNTRAGAISNASSMRCCAKKRASQSASGSLC
jgi:putative transposase